ncbi:MAG TPA: anthranilate synthase component I [Chitinispirillaceae bacterium]|nr:anthranilate synthase component I [Chitinispirillaceae bacterium]
MITPSLDEVKRLASNFNVIPVYKTVLADTETPVSVWLKLFKNQKYSFLLESVTGGDSVARYSFLGGDPFMTFKANRKIWEIDGPDPKNGSDKPVDALRGLFAQYKHAPVPGLPRLSGGAVGYFSYDSIRLWENLPDKNPKDDPLDDIFFAFYKDLIAFDNREHRLVLISNIIVEKDTVIEQAYKKAVDSIEQMNSRMKSPLPCNGVSIRSYKESVSNFKKEEYEKAVERCKEYIKAGDIFQVVLSQRFSIAVDADPFDMYRILRVINPSPYMYFLSLGQNYIIGASPEMLTRIENGMVEVRPIAGTRKRGASYEEDEILIKDLKADPKEIAEHVMLVDLGRNDVGRVCEYGSVHVSDMMHIEKYSHVIHLVSNVQGKLRPEIDAFDALYSCFPAGTLSGAPKIRAMEIIDELEPVKRGLYGGALGYIDFSGNMDTCIVIRTIIYHEGMATIQAGAGIVADSIPSREYQETVQKANAPFTAIKNAADITGTDNIVEVV